MRRIVVTVLALFLGLSAAGRADAGVVSPSIAPIAACLGIVHFPDVPVDGGPTKAQVGVVFETNVRAETIDLLISGASGDRTGSGPIGPDGMGFVEVGIFSYGEHVINEIVVNTPDGGFAIDPGIVAPGGIFIVDDNEPICDADVLGPAVIPSTTTTSTTSTVPETTTAPETTTTSTTTTSTSTTSTTAPPTTTASTEPPTTAGGGSSGDPGDGGAGDGGGWLPGILIGGGVVILIAGGIVLAGRAKNCDRQREELEAARQQLELINETLNEALAEYYESSAELLELENDLAELEASVARGGSRHLSVNYSVVDHERLSEGEVNAHRDYLSSMIGITRSSVTADEARLNEWSARFDAGAEKVRAAQAALATCEGRGAPAGPTLPTGPGEPSAGPTGPGVLTPPDDASSSDVCETGDERRVAGRPERMQQVVDFAIIVQAMEGSERKVGEAAGLHWDLARLGANIDAIGKALGARGAATSAIGGLRGIGSGSYVMGAGGLAKGTAEGAMASGVTDVDIPLSAPEAVVEVLEGLTKMTGVIAGKAGEWMKMSELYEVRRTLFCQTIVATPYEISTCVGGRWQCKQVWQYEVGPLAKYGKPRKDIFRLESERNRRLMRGQIRRHAAMAQRLIHKGVTDRAAFDARHQPGACQ